MTDKQIQEHVRAALDWEPSVDVTDVGITVDNGVVTLRGDVRTYFEKKAAERVALNVYGVKAVANDLAVHVASAFHRTDGDIASAVVNALRWTSQVPGSRSP
jgi:hypothetical protein